MFKITGLFINTSMFHRFDLIIPVTDSTGLILGKVVIKITSIIFLGQPRTLVLLFGKEQFDFTCIQ